MQRKALSVVIGDNLKRIRQERGFSKYHVKIQSGSTIADSTLTNLENGKGNVRICTLEKLCNIYEIDDYSQIFKNE